MKLIIPTLAATAALALGAVAVQSPQDTETLIEEYEEAEDDWKERLREADSDERRELRDQHPAMAYWDRFDAAAQAGDGRALLWMATHLREKGLSTRELKKEKPILLGQLFAHHASEPWFGEALTAMEREQRYLEEPQCVSLYEQAIEKNQVANIRAQAMYQLGKFLLASDDEAANAAGTKWLERASTELADTDFGMMARSELTKPVVGQLAPDFTGTTIDGYEFKLSDYRGKVVLLDFYGFW